MICMCGFVLGCNSEMFLFESRAEEPVNAGDLIACRAEAMVTAGSGTEQSVCGALSLKAVSLLLNSSGALQPRRPSESRKIDHLQKIV